MDNGQKAQLVNLCNSQGWALAQQLGNKLLTEMEQKALSNDDESLIVPLTRRARGAREFWDAFLKDLEGAKNPIDDSFIGVTF